MTAIFVFVSKILIFFFLIKLVFYVVKTREKEKSASKIDEKKKKEETNEDIAAREGLPELSWGQIMKMNSPEWPFIVVGAILVRVFL